MTSLGGDEPIMKECRIKVKEIITNKIVEYIIKGTNDNERISVDIYDIETGELIIEGYFLLTYSDWYDFEIEELYNIKSNVQLIDFFNEFKKRCFWDKDNYALIIDVDSGMKFVTYGFHKLVFVYILKLIYI